MGITHFDGISAINGYFQGPKGKETTFGSDGLYTAFYVDGNAGNNANDGKSWATAVKTVAQGIALADDDIAKTNHWDRRNRLYVNGGSYTESLTRFPEKTDIIGVGSTDFLAKAKLIGVQANSVAVLGCRFINMAFQNVTADETVNVKQYSHGISFINCDFLGNATTTIALLINDCADALVQGCRFQGTTYGVKQLVGLQVSGTGTNNNLHIIDNYFNCAVGITIDDTDVVDGMIARNYLDVTTLAIDENADRMIVADNRWISAAAVGSSYDFEVTKSVGNIGTGSDDTFWVPIPN